MIKLHHVLERDVLDRKISATWTETAPPSASALSFSEKRESQIVASVRNVKEGPSAGFFTVVEKIE